MKTVGIKQLKARLSEYVRSVRRGEVILVTDRDMVVAELRPPGSSATSSLVTSLEGRLSALEESGEVSLAAAPKSGWKWSPAGLGLSARVVSELLDDIRSDRDETR